MKTKRLPHRSRSPCRLRGRDFSSECNDCFVLSLAAAAGISYAEAHYLAARYFGRVPGKGVYVSEMLAKAPCGGGTPAVFEKRISFELVWAESRTQRGNVRSITLGRFVREHPVGSYIVVTHRASIGYRKFDTHAFAVCNGRVYDEGARWGRHSAHLRLALAFRVIRFARPWRKPQL